VVNYAEGIVEDWKHDELSSIFYSESEMVGQLLIDAFRNTGDTPTCKCAGLRKPTLLKEEI
jgi:5'-methylthioadenosine phosphorylase